MKVNAHIPETRRINSFQEDVSVTPSVKQMMITDSSTMIKQIVKNPTSAGR